MSGRHLVTTGNATRTCHKKVPCRTGVGFTTEPDGQENFDYEVTLDLAALDSIVRRAALNANGVSVRGPLKVRITDRRKI